MNHPFFFLPVIIYIYIFESIYYSLKCLKVHVCNYCRSAHFIVAPFLHRHHGYHSYLEVRVQSMQVHGVRALNDNVHVALEKGSYELDSTGSRTFYSCSFLFWLSVWINWFSLNKNSDEKSTLKFNHIRAVWENSHVMRFFQIRNKGIQAYTCRKFKKKNLLFK